ncbi:MAG: hypothetical protein ABIO44_03070 [Saprospiraceae bacterium]
MRIILILFILGAYLNIVKAQFGYRVDLTRHSYQQKAAVIKDVTKVQINSFGIQIGTEYWFRLKNYRVEFLPGIHLATDFGKNSVYQNYEITDIQLLGLFPILLYPLSFKDDCNCPTFKKQGSKLNKGFHFILQPGMAVNRRNVNHDSITTSSTVLIPIVGIGAGLDFGLNRLLTLTPFIMYTAYINDLIKATEKLEVKTKHQSINIGLRMRIHSNRKKF